MEEITNETIEAKRIEYLTKIGFELLKHRNTILTVLDDVNIPENLQ